MLRFCIPLRETLSSSISFTVINKYGKGAALQISPLFGTVSLSLVKGSSETGLFRYLSNHVLRSLDIPKNIRCEGHLLFQNIQKFNLDFKNAEKSSEKNS